MREPRSSEVVRLVALDVVNNAIQTNQITSQDRIMVRDGLVQYVRNLYEPRMGDSLHLDPPSIQNKITQSFTYLFVTMYKEEWTTFFTDILSLTSSATSSSHENRAGIILYLRTLIAVHDEIADVMVTKSADEQRKHMEVKDLVRQRDAARIASSWQEILSQWSAKDDTITELCLAAVGRWVSWTDISLVVNQTLLNNLFELVSSVPTPKRRNAAIEAFTEIVGKKMGPSDKLELIDFLRIKEVVSQLVGSPALTDLRSTSNYDTDLAESVAKLVNNTVFDVIKALESAEDGDAISQRGLSQLHALVPFILRFFSDEYDEVCSTVIPCLSDLLILLRKKAKANSALYLETFGLLPPILDAVIAKMRYDETSSWGNEDEQTDEAEFQDLRKRLQVLQQAVAAVDENLCIDKFSNVVGTTFDSYRSQGSQLDWRDLDLAMYEMFLFGDMALKNGGLYSKTKPVSPAAERLIAMMYKLAESGRLVVYCNDIRN